MTNGDQIAGVVGAGLTTVAGIAMAKYSLDMLKETGKLAKGDKVKVTQMKQTNTQDPTKRAIRNILG